MWDCGLRVPGTASDGGAARSKARTPAESGRGEGSPLTGGMWRLVVQWPVCCSEAHVLIAHERRAARSAVMRYARARFAVHFPARFEPIPRCYYCYWWQLALAEFLGIYCLLPFAIAIGYWNWELLSVVMRCCAWQPVAVAVGAAAGGWRVAGRGRGRGPGPRLALGGERRRGPPVGGKGGLGFVDWELLSTDYRRLGLPNRQNFALQHPPRVFCSAR
jgi:hypothetical protein